jgi:hypothetical protein
MRPLTLAIVSASFVALAAAGASAWGGTGHTLISRAGAQAFPTSLPEFVRTPVAIDEIAALGPELDRSKDAGRSHDADLDPGHYADIGDDGKIAGVVDLSALPATQRDYDRALQGANTNQYSQGYLPYALIDGWEQIAKDFAIWRVDRIGERRATTDEDKAYFSSDRTLRETLTLRDIGVWSHYVGDASQPLHVTIHFNGWGDYPNPNGYSMSRSLHSRFEGDFVRAHATLDAVDAAMSAPALSDAPIADQIGAYLRRSASYVPKLYQIEKRGGFNDPGSPEAVGFMVDRLADGASELRDLVSEAYKASDNTKVGYPNAITPLEAESGAAIPTRGISSFND